MICDGRDGGSSGLLVLPPSSDRLQNLEKYAVPAVTCSLLCHCGSQDTDVESPRQGPEWQASLGEGDKRVGAKEFSKPRSFPSSPLHLFSVTGVHDNASAKEMSSVNELEMLLRSARTS